MTKQLPQEIDDAIINVIAGLDEIKFHCDFKYCDWLKCKIEVQELIHKHLGPYLSLPKQEDLHTLLGKAFTILCNKDSLSEEDRLMRQQLEMRLENNSMNIDFKQEQEDTLSDKIHKGLIKHYEEDTTPIEKIKRREFVLEGERPCNTLLTDANMSRIDTMLSDVIEAVNSLISKQTNE